MEEKGIWRTVGGRRIFIKDGQSLTEAMKESGKFANKNNKDERAKQSVLLKQKREELRTKLYEKNNNLTEEEQEQIKKEIKELTNQKQELDKDLTEEDLKNARHKLENEKYSKKEMDFEKENSTTKKLIDDNKEQLHKELSYELYDIQKFENDYGIEENVTNDLMTKTMKKIEEMHENGEISDYVYENYLSNVNEEINNIMAEKGYEPYLHKSKMYYSLMPKAKTAYDGILEELNKKGLNYEISKSWNAGELPSIYIKSENGTFRIANHYNNKNQQFEAYDTEMNKTYSTKEYIDYQNTVIKDLEEFLK